MSTETYSPVKPLKIICREVSHHFDPLTLYELAARVVDSLPPPEAFKWSQNNVVKWMSDVVGLPQYKECILRNHIDGSRLLWLENPSILPMLNIHDHEHIKTINKQVRKLYSVEYIKFCRSIGLPPRKPLSHCTWFMSRTGPSGGIRRNWTRCDILRWMKVINPAPVPRSHWDIVWQDKPEFPKTLFGKIPPAPMRERLPRYGSPVETGNEYQVLRKFCIDQNIANQAQLIWTDRKNETPAAKDVLNESKKRDDAKKFSPGLIPKPINLKGLTGRRLLLARRLLPKQKFFK